MSKHGLCAPRSSQSDEPSAFQRPPRWQPSLLLLRVARDTLHTALDSAISI